MIQEKELFRQKINIADYQVQGFEKNFKKYTSHPITKLLLKSNDLGTSFEFSDRTFTIIGMTSHENIMLTEIVDGQIIYWEVTPYFVQMILERFYYENKQTKSGNISVRMKYTDDELYLNSKKNTKKQKSVEPIIETDNADFESEEDSEIYPNEIFTEDIETNY